MTSIATVPDICTGTSAGITTITDIQNISVGTWVSTGTDLTSDNWNSVIWCPELCKFVTVGSGATNYVATSEDGLTWTTQTAAKNNSWESVAWSKELELFVAVSSNGTNKVMTSKNGSDWNSVNIGDTNLSWTLSAGTTSLDWRTIIWAAELGTNGRFIAVGNAGAVGYSDDGGITWVTSTMGTAVRIGLVWAPEYNDGGTYSNGIAVAVQENGQNVILSPDGISWVNATVGLPFTRNYRSLAFAPNSESGESAVNGGRFVTIHDNGATFNDFLYTDDPDGAWSSTTPFTWDGTFRALTWIPDLVPARFVALESNAAGPATRSATSTDGINWTSLSGPSTVGVSGYITPLVWSPELNLMVALPFRNNTSVAISSDGTVWEQYTIFPGNGNKDDWECLAWAPELEIFCGMATNNEDAVIISKNGLNWKELDDIGVDINTKSVAWSPVYGRFCAVAFNNDGIYTTKNQSFLNNSWGSVVWSSSNSIFCAVSNTSTTFEGSDKRVMTSPDGINWTTQNCISTESKWNCVTWAEDICLFVAVADTTLGTVRVMTSSNGINWAPRTVNVLNLDWQSVTWSSKLGLFVAVASSGTALQRVMRSSDGVDWTSSSNTGIPLLDWKSVTWSPELELFVATASDNTTSLMSSADGINWVLRTAPVSSSYNSIEWSSKLGIFTAVSSGTSMISTTDYSTLVDDTNLGTQGVTTHTLDGKNMNIGPNANEINIGKYANTINIGTTFPTETQLTQLRTNAITNWNVSSTLGITTPEGIAWSSKLNMYVAVSFATSGSKVSTSPDGITWTTRTVPGNIRLKRVISINDRTPENSGFIAVGRPNANNNAAYAYSTNGLTWTTVDTGHTNFTLRDIIYIEELGFMVATGSEITSNNNVALVIYNFGDVGTVYDTTNLGAPGWNGIAWSPELGNIVIVGTDINSNWNATFSRDGANWIPSQLVVPGVTSTINWSSVAWSSKLGIFIAVSNETSYIQRSLDGVIWNALDSGHNGQWFNIKWNDELELFVVVGADATINFMSSPDGTKWTSQFIATASTWNDIQWSIDLNQLIMVATDSTSAYYSDRYYTPKPNDQEITIRAECINLGSGNTVLNFNKFQGIASIRDLKVDSPGGDATAGIWHTRDLNQIDKYGKINVSLNNNQVTIGPGKYYISISAPGFGVQRHKIRFQDITFGNNTLVGSSEFNSNTSVLTQTVSVINTYLTLNRTTVYELQHRVASTRLTNGFGAQVFTFPASTPTISLYSKVLIFKLA